MRGLLFMLAVAACAEPPSPVPIATGQVRGELTLFRAMATRGGAPREAPTWASALLRHGRAASRRRGLVARAGGAGPLETLADPGRESFVFGEVLVSFREGGLDEVENFSVAEGLQGYDFEIGAFAGPRVATVRVRDGTWPSRPLGAHETRWLRAQLAAHDAVARAELNHYRGAHVLPDDPAYDRQWSLPQLNLPAAWALTTGSSTVVVAVLDDGVNPHPDLGRVLPGFDFVEDQVRAGDGDGRDPVAHQVPRSHGTRSVWHGTHVAGTVGATADNGLGTAGVDWQASLLPVRVLGRVVPGRGQGTSLDVVAGIRWSVGLEVPGVPLNPHPAQVLNLSLGGGPIVAAEQDALRAATARGAVVVVAAGNENEDAGATALGGYDEVIVVGAVDPGGRRARYSNFGPAVDVVAPGGDLAEDQDGDGRPDGILSTYLDEAGTTTGLAFLEGTSMAAPHVAGVVALMKAVQPALTHGEAERILRSTATPVDCPQGCGAGLVNAAAAVLQAGAGALVGPARLTVDRANIHLGLRDEGRVQIFNVGSETLAWWAEAAGDRPPQLAASEGELGPGESFPLEFEVDRTGLEDGVHEGRVLVRGGGARTTVTVRFRVGEAPPVDVGPVLIGAVGFDEDGEVRVGGATETSAARGYGFVLTAEAGPWLVVAVADRNANGVLDAGDYWGLHTSVDNPETVEVRPQVTREISPFVVSPY